MSKRLRRARDRREHGLLDRILSAPDLARAVPSLPPDVLHRVIQRCGLEDCGPLVALATPGQLARVFDLDLWRPAAPGLDEQFDADRFGTWLEVMVDAGVASAAATLAAMDVDLVAGGLVQHVRVFDYAAVAPYVTLDGDLTPGFAFDDSPRCEVGGYVLSAKRVESWSAITAVLFALADAHGGSFTRIMAACRRQSSSRPEIDVHNLPVAEEQAMFDLAIDRETRRDAQGYVSPAQARAFLQAARRIDRRLRTAPPRDPITHAYFRVADHLEAAEDVTPDAAVAIIELLREAGVMPQKPRALLEGSHTATPRFARVRAHLQFVHNRDPVAYAARQAELAYLANVIAAGTTIQSRAIPAEEASNAAVAVCNLGLEHWPVHWRSGTEPDGLLIHHDLVSVFEVGWTVLHEDVCMYAADQLLGILPTLHIADDDAHAALERLRVRLTKCSRTGSPWDARDDLDAIAILDTAAWAAILGLIDHFPTMHAAVGALLAGSTRPIEAAAFEFISEKAQIRQVGDFMQRLPRMLGG